jgi:hypothetical protein
MFKDRLDTLFGLLILGSALLAGGVFWLSMDPPVTRVVMDSQGEVIEIKTSSSYKIGFRGFRYKQTFIQERDEKGSPAERHRYWTMVESLPPSQTRVLVWGVETEDHEHAITVVNEKRAMLLSRGLWGEGSKVRTMLDVERSRE